LSNSLLGVPRVLFEEVANAALDYSEFIWKAHDVANKFPLLC